MQILSWVGANITDARIKDMLLRRLRGETLADIGKVHNGISRERVRQLIAKELCNFPEFDEDNSEFLYWFKLYGFLTYENMHNIFSIPMDSYYYWVLKYSRNRKTTLEDFLNDPKLPSDLYKTALDQFPRSSQYKEYYWHDRILDHYKDVFANNPYERLTVIDVTRKFKSSGGSKRYTVYFVCKCTCGNIVTVATNNLDKTKSCGCAIQDNCIRLHENRRRCVRCIETGVIYDSMKEAGESLGIAKANILRACKNPTYMAGGYHWEYVGDKTRYPVRCIETGEIYPSISAASKKYSGVYMVLTGKSNTAGGYHWEYVDPDKNNLIRREERVK